MNGAEIAALVTAIAGVLGALGTYLKAAAATKSAQAAHSRIDALAPGSNVQPRP